MWSSSVVFHDKGRENVFRGPRLKLHLTECKLEWILRLFLYECVHACICGVCVCAFGLWVLECGFAGEKERVMFTFGACVSANFGCTSFFKPCLVLRTNWSGCSFTSSWCSFCSRSWSKPGCCLQTALTQKTPCHFSHRGTSAAELFCAWKRRPSGQSPQSGSQWPFLPNPWSGLSRYEQQM